MEEMHFIIRHGKPSAGCNPCLRVVFETIRNKEGKMDRLLQDEERITKILKISVMVIAAAEILVGIISIIYGDHLFFIAESIWAFGVIMLMVFHGLPLLGWKNMGVIMLIGFFGSLLFEGLGINFGVVFSQYTYNDLIPGPKIFGFNVYAMAGYAVAIYIIWATVQAAIGMTGNHLKKSDVILMPILCSIVITSVDFATDLLLATIKGAYDWWDEGVYYGIPFGNYRGWYIMGFFLFLAIAVFLYRQGQKGRIPETPKVARRKWFWAAPPLLYACIWLPLPLFMLIPDSYEVTTYAGQSFMTGDIYQGIAIVCTGAILGPALLAAVRVFRSEELTA